MISHMILIFSLFIVLVSIVHADSTCFVIRIAAAHAGVKGQPGSFEILLDSLKNQTGGHQWSAVVAYLE